MSEWFKKTASGVTLRRRILLLVTSVFVTLFMVVGPLANSSSAAENQIKASWKGDTLTYDDHAYAPVTTAPKYKNSTSAYQWIEKATASGAKDTAYVIYFSSEARTATSANLMLYTYTAPTSYTDPSPPLAIGVVPAGTNDSTNLAGASTETSCDARYFGGLGWLICSVSHWVADGVDGVYQVIKQFLEVDTITQSDNGIFQIWQLVLTLANVCFIIIFLIIVYSHLTSIGISNYSIKDMVPRLIIAAILVNFSFWICQFFVDISNILGYSIQSLFTGIQDKLHILVDINWGDITNLVLSGGTIAVGTLSFVAITAGSFGYLGFTLLGALITVGFSVLVAFIILAARQALIVVLVMLAPLAFIAMVLPSTKSLFDKWRKALTTLLLFFPIFALLFGGAELAGAAIINSQHQAHGGGSLTMVIVGLAVQFIPLAITPFIVQFSSGLLGRIAGLANDRKRGIVDRAKGWSQSHADDFRARKLANSADRRTIQRPNETGIQRALRSARPANMALALDRSRSNRERRIQRNKDYLAKSYEADELKRINNPHVSGNNFYARERERMIATKVLEAQASDHRGEIEGEARLRIANLRHDDVQLGAMRRRTALTGGEAEVIENDMKAADNLAVRSMIHRSRNLHAMEVRTKIRENEAASYKAAIDAEGEEAWKNREQNTGYLRVMRQQTDHTKKRAADIDASMSALDQRLYDEAVNKGATAQYQRIRDMKVQTIRDQKHAELNAGQVQADGERSYYRDFEGGNQAARQLRKQFVAIEQTKKESATIGNTLQKRADAHWNRLGTTDARIQQMRLAEAQATDSAKDTDLQWNTLVEDVRANGADSSLIDQSNQDIRSIAGDIQKNMAVSSAREAGISNLQDDQKANLLKRLHEDPGLREIASGGTRFGATKVVAQAQSQKSSMMMENIKNQNSIFSNEGYSVDDMLKAFQTGEMPDGSPADTVSQLAAMKYILEESGNNWSVQKVVDWAQDHVGMKEVIDSDGKIHYYDSAEFNQALANGIEEKDVPGNLTELTHDAVSDRRDTMQIVASGVRNSKNKDYYISATSLERMDRGLSSTRYDQNVGKILTYSETAIKGDIMNGKFEPRRIASSDPDELSRMVQVLRDSKFRNSIPKEKKDSLLNMIVQAQTSINTRDSIKDRERGLMNIVASYLEVPADATLSERDQAEIETNYYEVSREDDNGKYSVRVPKGTENAKRAEPPMKVPKEYDYTRQDDFREYGTYDNPL